MTINTVGARRGLRAALLPLLVSLLVLSMSQPAVAHVVDQRTVMFDSRGDTRGSFSYSHATGRQNVFVLADRRADGYNVSVTIKRKSGSSWVLWKTMSATNEPTQVKFCSIPGGQVQLTLQTWVIGDGLSLTEKQYWTTTACNH